MAGLFPQSFQLQTQANLTSLDGRHTSEECAKLCERRPACFSHQSGGGAGIGLLTLMCAIHVVCMKEIWVVRSSETQLYQVTSTQRARAPYIERS